MAIFVPDVLPGSPFVRIVASPCRLTTAPQTARGIEPKVSVRTRNSFTVRQVLPPNINVSRRKTGGVVQRKSGGCFFFLFLVLVTTPVVFFSIPSGSEKIWRDVTRSVALRISNRLGKRTCVEVSKITIRARFYNLIIFLWRYVELRFPKPVESVSDLQRRVEKRSMKVALYVLFFGFKLNPLDCNTSGTTPYASSHIQKWQVIISKYEFGVGTFRPSLKK